MGLFKPGEEEILLQLLMIVLDEGADNVDRAGDCVWRNIVAGCKAPPASLYTSKTRFNTPCSRIKSSESETSASLPSCALRSNSLACNGCGPATNTLPTNRQVLCRNARRSRSVSVFMLPPLNVLANKQRNPQELSTVPIGSNNCNAFPSTQGAA